MRPLQLDRRAFLGSAAALGATSVFPAHARLPDGDWAKPKALLDSYVAGGRLPGVAFAIGEGTRPPALYGAGTIARDSTTRVDGDTLWRIYSMTKPITGMAAMMLIEDGKLGLDQNIADFIPGFADPKVLVDPMKDLASRPATRPITVRNLLTHTAGLGYSIVTQGPLLLEYYRLGLMPMSASRMPMPGLPDFTTAPGLAAFADRLATLPLIADPGAKWSYSISLDLLGRVIEVASGMAFDRFLQTRIFDPLDMQSTWFQLPTSERHRMTTNYFYVTPAMPFPLDPGSTTVFTDKPAFPFGGAGLVSSARDYDRFLAMLTGGGTLHGTTVMKPATVKLAMSNLLPAGADTAGSFIAGQGFGAGGRVTMVAEGNRGVGTFGWGGAAATIGWVDPVRGIRAAGYAQFMPDRTLPFTTDFAKSVYQPFGASSSK